MIRSGMLLLVLSLAPPAAADFIELPGCTGEAGETFDRGGLFKAINGAADVFLEYGFERLDLRRFDCGAVTIEVSIYDQGTPLNAFGVFARERPATARSVTGGPGLVAPPRQCLLRQGRHYVKIGAMRGALDAAACKPWLVALAEALPGSSDLPQAFAALPAADRLAGSAGYTPESYLGLSELGPAVHARYQRGGQQVEIFRLLPGPDRALDAIWQRLAERWKAAAGTPPVLLREVPYRGLAGIVRTPDEALGAIGAGDRKATIDLLRGLAGQRSPSDGGIPDER